MRAVDFQQHIDLKRIFIILTAFCILIMPFSSAAQTPPPPTPSPGLQIFQDFQNGVTTLTQATTQLSTQAGILPADAQGILTAAQTLPTAVQGAVGGMLDDVISGVLPPNIAQILPTIPNFGQLLNATSIAQIFQNPTITAALNGMLPAQAQQAINAITSAVSDLSSVPAAALAAAQAAIANAVASALQSALPGLVAALGGQAAVAGAINALLGGSGGTATPTGPSGSCTAQCNAQNTCERCSPDINRNHQLIRAHVTAEFQNQRNWFISNFFIDNIAPALGLMTSQLTTTGMQKMQIIGTFFDAKHQLETQRLFQTLTAEAHKDYHPSEELCAIGTNTRSLISSERRSDLTHAALARRMMDRQLLNAETSSMEGEKSDRRGRLDLFVRKYCNPDDHGGGLQQLCASGGISPNQVNMDIDYTNTIDNKLTLDIDFSATGSGPATEDEENVFMLGSYLFANDVLPLIAGDLMAYPNTGSPGNPPPTIKDNAYLYLDIRSLAAKRSVAQNSFAAITALKAEGDSEAAPFLKAVLEEAGIDPTDIEARLGENPSYFAQMEVLTKLIYQNPKFFSGIIDKPANNERMAAIIEGISNMQDRDIHDSIERSNAILATLISVLSQKEHDIITNSLRCVDEEEECL